MSVTVTKLANVTNGQTTTTVTLTTIVDAPVGTKIIVAGQGSFFSTGSNYITGASDSAGNTYVADVHNTNGNNAGSSIAHADVTTDLPSGSTISLTINNAAAATTGWFAYVVTGLATGNPIDTKFASASGTHANITTGALTGDVFCFTVAALNDAETVSTVSGGFTILDTHNNTKSGVTAHAEFTGLSSTAETCTFTNNSVSWSEVIATWQQASGSSPQTIILGEATSTATAYGPTLVPGAVTTILGEAVSTPTAFGVKLTPSIALGIAASTPQGFGINLVPGAATVILGEASSTPTAFGPTLVPGAVAVVLGEAVSTPQGFGIDVRSAVTLALGIASSTPQALGLDLSPGVKTVVLGVAQSTATALGLDLAPGGVTTVLGRASSIASAFGLDLSALIPASPYTDPYMQIQVVLSQNSASPLYPIINQAQVDSSENLASLIVSGVNSITITEEG